MPETMNLPAVGPVNKRIVIIVGAGAAGIIGYAWWRRGSAADETLPEETLGDDLPFIPDGFGDATIPGGSTVDGGVGDPSRPPITNIEWHQRLTDMLEGVGYERQFAANTLGKYLSGQTLTAAEKLLVMTAVGLLGYPPAGALPILGGQEPTTPPPGNPPPTSTTVWQGHRLPATTTWMALATKFAKSKTPNGIESTRRAIMDRNPSIVNKIGKGTLARLQRGWIVLVPIHK
jgi:hypothetical protein